MSEFNDLGKLETALAQRDALAMALKEIVLPVWFIQQRAKEQGLQVDGAVAVNLANDPNYLRRIAHQALTAAGEPITPPISSNHRGTE